MRRLGLLILPALTGAVGFWPGGPARDVVGHQVPVTADLQRRVLARWTPGRMLRAAEPRAAAPAGAGYGGVYPGGGAVRRTTGKVFFTLGGRDHLCSASTVRSANRDLVVTAGHCVKNGAGAWADNWIFVPGYHDGAAPYGGFTARSMFVPDRWSARADADHDVAMVALAPAGGRHVTDVVGAPGIAFDHPGDRPVHVFGYPSTGPYDGERLAYCAGATRRDPYGAANARGVRCDLTQGSSGGPWLAGFDPATGTGVITSVSSFKYVGDGRTMYAPRFGDTVRRLYEQAQRA